MLRTANAKELGEILKLFYQLSGIRIVVFDESFREIIAYPEEMCAFCRQIRSHDVLSERCEASDYRAFCQCRDTRRLTVYQCHMGLVEAAVPLLHGDRIIGYVMFGQITDVKDQGELQKLIDSVNRTYRLECSAKGLRYRSEKQLAAAAKLLEICTEYMLFKEMVVPQFSRCTMLAREYIAANLEGDLEIAKICRYAGTNRTTLYEAFSKECGIGISAYIRKTRLELARKLLKTTELSVSEVSKRVGFYDYNYFSRVFKKEFGISPHKLKR